ncbi:outer membrane protein [Bradyrhizobium sp.]|uniref:outer membrane protein n=1 Tax=Bradyrhizobium sp. TaxID=376 RepID=UPI001E014684|nr:outer membrane beta-barrel protein [Bradyrhizobium sp.]MBV8701594.1 porin family protein [Bradyrhizobium sp.]MBV8917606.1 porin family protein [Bradyrhizobium sp.]MBV9985052.1 porin family protein [Bradyrhizobium sp.]
MRRVCLLIAGTLSLWSTATFAADMPIMPPPAYAPPPPQEFSGWYLRGDVGMTNQSIKSLNNPDPNAVLFTQTGVGFDSSPLFDIGVGYQFNNWFRADVTGQYRGRANFHGSQFTNVFAGSALVDNYTGAKSETVVMLNGYVDLGTWWCITPYIGAGVGASYNRIHDFRDDGFGNTFGVARPVSFVYATDAGKWNFAWAVHAGLGYKVTPNATVELGYSYMNLGDATTGTNSNFAGTTTAQFPWTMHDITSHDLKLGVRWNLDNTPVYAPPPPLIRKG